MGSTIEQLTSRVRARRQLPAPAVRRIIRTEAGASLDEVARVVGVTRQAVGLWEAGARTPRGKNLDEYVAVLQALRDAVAV